MVMDRLWMIHEPRAPQQLKQYELWGNSGHENCTACSVHPGYNQKAYDPGALHGEEPWI